MPHAVLKGVQSGPVTLPQLYILQANKRNNQAMSHCRLPFFLTLKNRTQPKKKKHSMPLPPEVCGITLLHLWQREALICLSNSLHRDRCWTQTCLRQMQGPGRTPYTSSCPHESLLSAMMVQNALTFTY